MHQPPAVNATNFRTATAEDWDYVTKLGRAAMEREAGRAVVALLKSQKDVPLHGWQVNNYEHSLQCATRALKCASVSSVYGSGRRSLRNTPPTELQLR